jgi:CheY-like chemotaxis protein
MQSSGLTICLIDDSESDRSLFRLILSEIDPHIQYIGFSTALEALQWLQKCSQLPDYIFLDINMPGMDGIECLEQIKADEHTCKVPVIMYSTSDARSHIESAKRLGAQSYMRKSVDYYKSVEDIGAILEDMLKQK